MVKKKKKKPTGILCPRVCADRKRAELLGAFAGDVIWGPWDSTVNWAREETWALTFPLTLLCSRMYTLQSVLCDLT